MPQRFFFEGFQWSTIELHDDDDEIIKFQVRCFGAHFEIQYQPHNLSLSPYLLKHHYSSLALIRTYEVGDNRDARDAQKALDEIHRLKKPFGELMSKLAPNPPPSSEFLSDYLYPPYLILEAIAPGPDSTTIQPCFKGEFPRQLRWPGEQHPCLRGPTKVIAGDGTVCYYKDLSSGLSPLGKEKPWIHIQNQSAIEAKKLRPNIKICRLHSVIIDDDREVLQHWFCATKEELLAKWEDDGSCGLTPEQYADPNFSRKRLVGMLLHYIENKGTLEEIAPWSDCSYENRRRWATELEGLIEELHAAGLIWGDAKPNNVLVDQDDRLWLIDLEGSYTAGLS